MRSPDKDELPVSPDSIYSQLLKDTPLKRKSLLSPFEVKVRVMAEHEFHMHDLDEKGETTDEED